MTNSRRRLTNGGWKVTDGGWRVADGGWGVTDGNSEPNNGRDVNKPAPPVPATPTAILRLCTPPEQPNPHTIPQSATLAMAAFACWFYLPFFCMGFRLTGPFVVITFEMLHSDIPAFLLVAFSFLGAFASAMYILAQQWGLEPMLFHFKVLGTPATPDVPDQGSIRMNLFLRGRYPLGPDLPPLPSRLKNSFSGAFGATVLCISGTIFDETKNFGARNCRVSVGEEEGHPPPLSPPPRL